MGSLLTRFLPHELDFAYAKLDLGEFFWEQADLFTPNGVHGSIVFASLDRSERRGNLTVEIA